VFEMRAVYVMEMGIVMRHYPSNLSLAGTGYHLI
jgi:hypothetical protein